jgi:peptide/nickel transport system ATP-binding protein
VSRGKELLHVKGLNLSLNVRGGSIKIVEGLDLKIHEGEAVGLIGPTDAGKTVTAKALLGVLQPIGKGKPVWNIEGEVVYRGKDLFKMPEEEFRNLRGNEISMIFQKPRSSLHPIHVIGDQTGEPVEAHEDIEKRRLREMVVNYLDMVELPEPKRRFNFPRDKFSGGEAQRIMIAMALICKPSLLIADEPTSDLDVIVQGQVLELLKRMKREFGLSMLLITHHLGVIAETCNYVYVMYAGRIIEHGNVRTIFKEPKHPYTRGLLNAVPRIDADHFEMKGIRGDPPRPPYNIPGCMFHPRCEYVVDRCMEKAPALEEVEPGHHVACHRSKEI